MNLRTALSFAVITMIWGSTWLVIRDQLIAVPPEWSVTYRFALGTMAMFALAAIRRQKLWIGPRAFGLACLLGLVQFSVNFNFVYRAEQHLTSGIVAMFFALQMIPNSLLAWLVFRQPVSRGFIAGSVVATAGVFLLFLHEYRVAVIDPAHVLLGIVLCLGAVLGVSIGNVMQVGETVRKAPMLSLLAWAMLVGAAIDFVIALISNGPPVFDPRPAYLAGLLYLGVIGSVLTFPIYFGLIRVMGAGRAAYSGVAVPVIAMLLSTIFENYRWSTLAAAGAVLSIIGTLIALRSRESPSTKVG